jgi:acyl carrier protein
MDADQILADITRMLGEVIGEEYLMEFEITPDTAFSGDLELESIEFVALAGLLKEHYGSAVDFVGFLADMDLHQIIALRVGQVVELIEGSLVGVGSCG